MNLPINWTYETKGKAREGKIVFDLIKNCQFERRILYFSNQKRCIGWKNKLEYSNKLMAMTMILLVKK